AEARESPPPGGPFPPPPPPPGGGVPPPASPGEEPLPLSVASIGEPAPPPHATVKQRKPTEANGASGCAGVIRLRTRDIEGAPVGSSSGFPSPPQQACRKARWHAVA